MSALTFNLPPPNVADVQIFNRPSIVNGAEWMTWLKPRGRTMCHITCIGSGAGAGGGFTGVAASARGGGGGGGSSASTRLLVPLMFLPDRLYISVAGGGIGRSSGGGAGGVGNISYVSITPDNTIGNLLTLSGNAGATGGGTGTAAAGGAAGAAGSIATVANMYLSHLGNPTMVAGQAGIAGGSQAGAVGGAQFIPSTTAPTMGGSGGAGTTSADFAGGLITASAGWYISEVRPINAAAGSFNGSGGHLLAHPFFSFCGLGGGSSNTGIGGAGGNGGPGSGGGGGGGGTTGGKGGEGGNGIVIIVSW